MSKKMCELVKKKLPKENPEKYRAMIKGSRYFCRQCGLTCTKKSHLCKPEEL